MGLSIKLKIILVSLLLLLSVTFVVTTYTAYLQKEQAVFEDQYLFSIFLHRDFIIVYTVALLISLIIIIAFSYTILEPVDKLIIGTQ